MDYSNGNNGSYWHPDDQWHTHADDISNICYYDNSTQAAQQIPATYVTSAVTDMEEHDSDEDQPKEQPEEQPEDQPEYQGH